MSYTIRNSDGTVLLSLADNTVDRSATSLSLVGKNIRSYGEYFNNNLIQILSNSANTSGNPPRNPLKGQIWYNTTNKRLQVYDNGFKPVSGAIISASKPADLFTGDLWFDSSNNQLKLYSGNVAYLIGPAYPASAGVTGWLLPPVSIKDTSSVEKQVVLLKVYGKFIGLASNTEFNLSSKDSLEYFNTSTTTTVVSGITIFGDIKYTGKITNKHLSMSIDLDKSDASVIQTPSMTFASQNQIIADTYLIKMFPIITTYEDTGLPLGTEARVLCTGAHYQRNINQIVDPGMQTRRFRVVDQPGIGISWQPYLYNAPGQNGSNIVP